MGAWARSSSATTPSRRPGAPLSVRPGSVRASARSLVRRGFRASVAEARSRRPAAALHVTFDDAYRASRPACRRWSDCACRPRSSPAPGTPTRAGLLDVPELADEAAAHPEELATMGWDELRSPRSRRRDRLAHRQPPAPAAARRCRARAGAHRLPAEARGRAGRALPLAGLSVRRARRAGPGAAERAGYEAAFSLASTTI